MIDIFGPNSGRVLALVDRLHELTPTDLVAVTDAWRHTNGCDRAEAWVEIHRAFAEQDRYRILAAASVARRAALEIATRYRLRHWGFWAAAADAGAAVAAGDRICSHYETLVSPLATVVPDLLRERVDTPSRKIVRDAQGAPDDALPQGA